jgi:transposase
MTQMKARAPRRRWTTAEKRQIVSEAMAPGASVSGVARRYAVNANLVFKWLRQYPPPASGSVEASDGTGPPDFCAVVVEDAAPVGRIEIHLPCGTQLRFAETVDEQALNRVLRAVRAG